MWITEYMLNSAGFAYQQAGFLQYNLTQSDVSSSQSQLSKSSLNWRLNPETGSFFNEELVVSVH